MLEIINFMGHIDKYKIYGYLIIISTATNSNHPLSDFILVYISTLEFSLHFRVLKNKPENIYYYVAVILNMLLNVYYLISFIFSVYINYLI